jgi:hypothetical protein
MWEFECSEQTSGSSAAVWALWSDPTRWPEFDPGLAWARLDEPFAVGATGTWKRKGGPKSAFEIVAAQPERSFVIAGKLPFSRLRLEHELSDGSNDSARITHRIHVTGPLGPVYARLLHLQRNEVAAVANLARMAAAKGPSGTEPARPTGGKPHPLGPAA